MGNYYKKLFVKKREIIMCFIIMCILICYNPISEFLVNFISNKYGQRNIDYLMRILTIVQIVISFFFLSHSFRTFERKSLPSLQLLGMSNRRILLVFCLTHISFILVQICFNFIFFYDLNSNRIQIVLSGVCNAILLMCFMVLFAQSVLFHYLKFFVGIGTVVILFCFLYLQNVNYESAYRFIMDHPLSEFFYKYWMCLTYPKIGSTVILCFLINRLCDKRYLVIDSVGSIKKRINLIGDIEHRIGKKLIWKKNYLMLYRNFDFVTWKIFSSCCLLFCYFASLKGILFAIILYIICLIASTYLLNYYETERNVAFIYYMAHYSYSSFIKKQMAGGMLVIADNLALLLLFFRMDILYIVWVLGVALFLSAYITNSLYAGYPNSMDKISFIKIMLNVNIPLLNCTRLAEHYKHGKKNWGEIANGKKHYAGD